MKRDFDSSVMTAAASAVSEDPSTKERAPVIESEGEATATHVLSPEAREAKKVSRRNFLKILGTTSAAGVAGCASDKEQKIFPYFKDEASSIPGEPTWYKTTCTECSAHCGMMVKTVDGRTIKVEGNPEHPVSRGGLCALGQASLQGLYDPDRVRQPLQRKLDSANKPQFVPITWDEAFTLIGQALGDTSKKHVAITSAGVTAHTDLFSKWASALGGDVVHYDTHQAVALAKATELVFGFYGVPKYQFEKADLILNFGADFLETWVSPVEYTNDWAKGRRRERPVKFIHVEPRLSLTGANADTWLNTKPGTEIVLIRAFLKELLDLGYGERIDANVRDTARTIAGNVSLVEAATISGVAESRLKTVLHHITHAERPLVVVGGAAASVANSVALHAAGLLLNALLKAPGKTVQLVPSRKPQSEAGHLVETISDLQAEKVGVLFMHGSNPAFTLPSSFGFSFAARKAALVVSLSPYFDETADVADLVLPIHSGLESLGYDEPRDGIRALIQPTMAPVFDTKDVGDIILTVAEKAGKKLQGELETQTMLAFVRGHWKGLHRQLGITDDFEKWWVESLANGGIFTPAAASAAMIPTSAPSKATLAELASLSYSLPELHSRGVEEKGADKKSLVLYPFHSVKSFDGRAANRPWLQELPDPITQLVWEAWAEINPETAKDLNVEMGDLISVQNYYGQVTAPAYITTHVAAGMVAIPIGQGHQEYGRYAKTVGAGNVVNLLAPTLTKFGESVPLVSATVLVSRAAGDYTMVSLSGSKSQEDRGLARTRMIDERAAKAAHASSDNEAHHGHGEHGTSEHAHEPKQMYEQREHPLYRWGMAIDLASCTGCSACVVACYAENNIPVVGKDLCNMGREMSWLRIERYYDDETPEELKVSFLPMLCQHCNNAPCEPVCPVYATYHNPEGLNAMVYNRCVGTRYCSNNCSYKVRRFNWVEFDFPEPLDWQLNPAVTKRTSGVMEKCTFCVHRIKEAQDRAKDEGRFVRDGEIQPACVQTCPADALTFGNLKDPESKVSKLHQAEGTYKILDHHINTQPAIGYLEDVKYRL